MLFYAVVLVALVADCNNYNNNKKKKEIDLHDSTSSGSNRVLVVDCNNNNFKGKRNLTYAVVLVAFRRSFCA